LKRGYETQEDSAGLYRVWQTLLERHPQSIIIKNNVATLGLLLGKDRARSLELAREVYEAGKTNVTVVSTYAFALHTEGKSNEGLKRVSFIASLLKIERAQNCSKGRPETRATNSPKTI